MVMSGKGNVSLVYCTRFRQSALTYIYIISLQFSFRIRSIYVVYGYDVSDAEWQFTNEPHLILVGFSIFNAFATSVLLTSCLRTLVVPRPKCEPYFHIVREFFQNGSILLNGTIFGDFIMIIVNFTHLKSLFKRTKT